MSDKNVGCLMIIKAVEPICTNINHILPHLFVEGEGVISTYEYPWHSSKIINFIKFQLLNIHLWNVLYNEMRSTHKTLVMDIQVWMLSQKTLLWFFSVASWSSCLFHGTLFLLDRMADGQNKVYQTRISGRHFLKKEWSELVFSGYTPESMLSISCYWSNSSNQVKIRILENLYSSQWVWQHKTFLIWLVWDQ